MTLRESVCPGCGVKVACASPPGQERCWCAEFPRVLSVPDPGSACLCPDCLRRKIDPEKNTGPRSP